VEDRVRLADLVAALSLGVDLGFGQPMEHVLRQCLIALRLAELAELDDETRSAVYYTALLVNVACHSDAHEQAKWFGDDIEMKSHKYDHEMRSLRGALAAIRLVGRGNPPLHRFRVGVEFAVSGHRDFDGMIARHAALACTLAKEIGLPVAVQDGVSASYEQWNGKGWPGELSGEEIPVAARLAQIAEFTEVAHRLGGVEAADALLAARAGSQFDPQLTDLLRKGADTVFASVESTATWDLVIAAEPSLRVTLTPDELDAALTGIARFVDLKSPFTLGHSVAVSALGARAAKGLGMSAEQVASVKRAGLVVGFGRLGVSNAIWDKADALGAGELERVRMQPYLTERMLRQSSWLAPVGAVAVLHRERLDGSGYPRGLSGGAISPAARVLAVADSYQAMREPRPYRAALSREAAAAELRSEVTAGRLDADAVAAVLGAAGHETRRRTSGPSGLTTREVEVLRLVAQGLSSKQIGDRLVISTKTARNHIEHIYTKLGVSSRVAASLYAVEQGLIPE
jgi:HD-GYP domain-containing protein (c-di-GMP phosphodiesterase class II)